MEQLAPGQRVISDTDIDLGLGVVLELNARFTRVLFPAIDEERMYASGSAPLTRYRLDIGDTGSDDENRAFEVLDVEENNGKLAYQVMYEQPPAGDELNKTQVIGELELSAHLVVKRPDRRLFLKQVDKPNWFDLRADTLEFFSQHIVSQKVGVSNSRVALIPHQLSVMHHFGAMLRPRVMLADEVGLGKTIEACLILQRQLKLGLVSRVLIVVPEALLVQWMFELNRRFALRFTTLTAEDFKQDEQQEVLENPFNKDPFIIISEKLLATTEASEWAAKSHWDLVIVDEAHHLDAATTQHQVTINDISALLAEHTGLLLLTATPDQLGEEQYFALLSLLDPAAYQSIEDFRQQQKRYMDIAEVVADLLDPTQPLDEPKASLIADLIGEHGYWQQRLENIASHPFNPHDRLALSKVILDCHGNARVMVRNRRCHIEGFNKRQLHCYPLTLPDIYKSDTQPPSLLDYNAWEPSLHLSEIWLDHDPRVDWLERFLADMAAEKFLLICHHKHTAKALHQYINRKTSFNAALFTEDMTLLERDRAAHYFSAQEDSAQVLICSEIGSEGRNFQFVQHLVLFDLPMNPDLLEQRIGRLDRIGQQSDIHLHLPYFENSPTQRLFDIYHNGLNAFEKTSQVHVASLLNVGEEVMSYVQHAIGERNALQQRLQQIQQTLETEREQGANRLLDLQATVFHSASDILDDCTDVDAISDERRFIIHLLEAFGYIAEPELGYKQTFIVRPTESVSLQLIQFDEEGTLVTFDRDVALLREDAQYWSMDHPTVQFLLDAVEGDVVGKATIGTMALPELAKGTFLVQGLFTLFAVGKHSAQLRTFLPCKPLILSIDPEQRLFDLPFTIVNSIKLSAAHKLIDALSPQIKTLIRQLQGHAEEQLEPQKTEALKTLRHRKNDELARLEYLKKHNVHITEHDIQMLNDQYEEYEQAILQAGVAFEAVRVLVNNP